MEFALPAEEGLGWQPPQPDVGIRDGELFPPMTIGNGTRIGAGAFRPDSQSPSSIDPRQRRIVVVKSTNHFMAAFGPIAKRVIYVDSDAPLARDYRKIAYQRVERPIWPLDEETKPGLIF